MKLKRLLFFMLLPCFLILCSCSSEAQTQFFAMDTTMSMTVSAKDAKNLLAASEDEIVRLETLLSRTREDSAVSALNRGESVENSELAALAADAIAYSDATGGAFDITVSPIVSAWGFTEDAFRVPTEQELSALLSLVGSSGINLEGSTLSLAPDVSIDLGGIAKGYASDRIAALWEEGGAESGCAALGGNVYVRGYKSDGSLWRVAVRDPRNTAGAIGVLSLNDAFAVTSGGYERYFTENGTTYHHIIDPATGYPAQSGLLSVTVVSHESGTLCDAYSTALFVLGEGKALELYRAANGAFELILVTEDGRVVITEGLADAFEKNESSSYRYEILG
ncbi:MAG: FAD:protein FMN transferase [Oscillospiraceae bacterium]|nr:FAD:protein FMN transferase [Oscillospiraceae bacterium]